MSIPMTKILLIEDNPADVRLLQEALGEIADCRFEISLCETLAESREFLDKNTPDVILSDIGLPDSQGLQTVRYLHEIALTVPIVVLTSMNDDVFGRQLLRDGAQDYLVKGQVSAQLLWRALRYAMARHQVQLNIMNVALVDSLTGLNNRQGFLTLAEYHAALAYQTGKPFLVAFVDLDGLQRINETFGHQEGNRALVDASLVLKDCFRQSDILARIGGDEFAVLVADADEKDAETIRHRVDRKLRTCNEHPERRYQLSFSMGVVSGDTSRHSDIEKLLAHADALMYVQKRDKRESCAFLGASTAPDAWPGQA
ncbi:MAG TPA: GGDEF domain-containing response regulator [Candidatus Saccharimonadales bacterium]|jgi:two-component system cell cycle response regulator|nr:GGDEF domain-containing response regulator [Candidatus Saccharimonadales bacterium]